jgi:hypothetical protein
MRRVVKDGVEHIQSNMKLSNIAVGLTPQCSPESVFNVMRVLAAIAMFVEGVGVLIGILGIVDWAGVADIPHIRIAAKTQAASSGANLRLVSPLDLGDDLVRVVGPGARIGLCFDEAIDGSLGLRASSWRGIRCSSPDSLAYPSQASLRSGGARWAVTLARPRVGPAFVRCAAPLA